MISNPGTLECVDIIDETLDMLKLIEMAALMLDDTGAACAFHRQTSRIIDRLNEAKTKIYNDPDALPDADAA